MPSLSSSVTRAFCLTAAFTLGASACVRSEPDATDDATGAAHEEPTADDSSDPDSSCPSGQEYFVPGCGTEPNLLQAGCYQTCEGEADDSCTGGAVCTAADINPCVCPGEGECCAACGQALWLCQAPSEAECSDVSRDPIVLSATEGFGFCDGECRFALSLSAGDGCDVAELVVSDNGQAAEPLRTNHGVLTPIGHAAIRERVADLGDVAIDDRYGCPDCTDGGSSGLTLRRSGQTSETLYEYGNPPELLAPLDEVTQAIIYALQTCESNNVVEVLDCTTEAQLTQSLDEIPCEDLGEDACGEDERCQVVRASPVDEAAQCRGPVQFAGCAPASHNTCTAAITVARDAQDRCWWFTGDCAIPGFEYTFGDGDCRPVPECGTDPARTDTSGADAGNADAGNADAGNADAGNADAGRTP